MSANQSTNSDVKAFFETMAAGEVQHVQILSDPFKAFRGTGKFKATILGIDIDNLWVNCLNIVILCIFSNPLLAHPKYDIRPKYLFL